MNYHQHPVPTWITPEKWDKTIKEHPYKVECIIRDGYKCQDCNDGSKKLIVHHIDDSRKLGKKLINNNLSNLVTLCKRCHANRHGYNKTGKSRERIIELFEKYSDSNKNLLPGVASLISVDIGLSRERVRQLANKMGYITYSNKKNVFNKFNCLYCGKPTIRKNKQYCSVDCSKMASFYRNHVLLQCKGCQLYFVTQRSDFENHGRKYCSKICFGKYAGENYGFKKHPENAVNGLNSKYSLEEIEKEFPDGFTTVDFVKRFGYKSIGGASNAIRNLIVMNKVEQFRLRGLYRLKKNPSLT